MKAEQIISTFMFVIFSDNLTPIAWKSTVPIKARILKGAGKTTWRISSTRKSTSRYPFPKHPWNGRIEESSGNASWWIVHTFIERNSCHNTRAHFTDAGIAGKDELFQRDKCPTPSSFMHWKIRFKTHVSSCPDFPSEAMLWIKEVDRDMEDSLADWPNRTLLQVMSPMISLKWTRQRLHLYSSTDRAWCRFMILLKALLLALKNLIWTMSKIRGMLASPLHTGERSKRRATTSLSLLQSQLCVMLITFPSKCGETCSYALTQKNVESRISLRQRRYSVGTSSSSRIKKKEALSRFSESESDTRLILADQGDHTLSEAKCEILKQECRADRADCAIRELQRQIHSSRLEIDHTNLGNEKSRRKQARFHEELAQRERALRETHIKRIH